jgi:diadenosine tetraphosphate (Ap4A) HIT family hydrolase
VTEGCLFCDPVEQAGAVAWNTTMYARFDRFPATPGHVLIIPKTHVDSFFDLSPQQLRDAYDLLWGMRLRLAAEHCPHGWNIGVNDGRAAGRTVHHLHIHLIPRYLGDQDDPRGGIRRGLPNGDPDAWAAACHHPKETDYA